MMNSNNSSTKYNSRPTMPNRATETTTTSATATPMRFQVPRLRKRAATPRSISSTPFLLETPDRFIPRSRMSTSRARASLVQQHASRLKQQGKVGTTSSKKKKAPSQCYYESQLRLALFGTEAEETPPMMAFGPTPSSKRSKMITPMRLFAENNDPYRQDILRSTALPGYDQRQQPRRPQRVSIKCERALDAPDLLVDDNLTLMGYGQNETLAVALNDRVYLWNKGGGKAQLLAQEEDGYSFSCVQWSNDGKYLALGTDGGVHIFCPQISKKLPVLELWDHHSSHVTAIAWNGQEMVAACRNGITRYDPTGYERHSQEQDIDEPVQATYCTGHDAADGRIITSLQWTGNTIVGASAASGEIKIWESTKNGRNIQPLRIMHHIGVKSLEINPRQPHMLVSAGDDGVKFWNIWSGKLRSEIPMEVPASKTACSTSRDEIIVAHGNCLSLWSLGPKVEMLVDYCTGVGKITGLVRGLDGSIVCAHEDETLTFNTCLRQVTKDKARATVAAGFLEIPTLR